MTDEQNAQNAQAQNNDVDGDQSFGIGRDNKPNQTFNIQGGVKGGFVMMGGTATFHGGTFTYTEGETSDDELRSEIEKMIEELKVKAAAEAEDPKEALKVEMAADSALEAANEPNPEPGIRKIRGDDLMKAAQNIAAVTPLVVDIAKMLLLLK